MISQLSIQKILGIRDKIHLAPVDMANELNITFFPGKANVSAPISDFAEKLRQSFLRLRVNIVPYSSAFEQVPLFTRIRRFIKYTGNNIIWAIRNFVGLPQASFFIPFDSILKLSGGKRVKKGISIVCLGKQEVNELPMQFISSFKSNSIITILDFPKSLDENTDFSSHFDTMMALFAYHMTNIVIAVDTSQWMVYNFNASHPVFALNDGKFDKHILDTLVPKIVAPISPHTFKEFKLSDKSFDIHDAVHLPVVREMQNGAELFDHTHLYPAGKKIDELPFRHNFHRLIGKIHLDNRSGMSFGFIAFQMPIELKTILTLEKFSQNHPGAFINGDCFVDVEGHIYILFELKNEKLVMEIPEVWVMTLRSGADKTHFDPVRDLLKIGLKNGEMWMQFPAGISIGNEYKPSFDTKVILAHAVGNAIIASIIEYFNSGSEYAKYMSQKGFAISHWHGYFNKTLIPPGVCVYGIDNPHVSCSSPQSAVFALGGKLESFFATITEQNSSAYMGDIHIEPHHGVNINYPSLISLAEYILNNPTSTQLGNKYL
jgi:hypothetical protein